MSLADYLAQKYLTKDEPDQKKNKKRKRKEKEGGIIIADDDALGWDDQGSKNKQDDEDGPVIVATKSFRKATKSNWTTVDAETAEADAIIAEASRKVKDPEDLPVVVDDKNSVQKLSSGAHAGLQTAEQVEKQMERQRNAELARWAAADPEESGRGKETIYRDASGRIINLAMQRAELRKKMEEEEAKKQREIELNKGEVQVVEQARRKKELEDAKYMTMARYADDREMNEELKERERWNDPAAAFLTSKKKGVSRTGKPLYKGAAPPNRYGILPGHKWDGVDRGNGFEKKWFQAQNATKNRQQLEYQWQLDE
ncbi:Pre-mRNA-splicing factor cwc26 [Rhizina undulata]